MATAGAGTVSRAALACRARAPVMSEILVISRRGEGRCWFRSVKEATWFRSHSGVLRQLPADDGPQLWFRSGNVEGRLVVDEI